MHENCSKLKLTFNLMPSSIIIRILSCLEKALWLANVANLFATRSCSKSPSPWKPFVAHDLPAGSCPFSTVTVAAAVVLLVVVVMTVAEQETEVASLFSAQMSPRSFLIRLPSNVFSSSHLPDTLQDVFVRSWLSVLIS